MVTMTSHPVVPLDELLAGGLSNAFHPLVDLDTGRTVGHEALLRGPAGTPWEAPLTLLAAAREAGRLAELDLHSASASVRAAAAHVAATGVPVTVFVNVEPGTLTSHPAAVVAAVGEPADGVQVVVEITERALADDPAAVLAGAERLRAAGCAIALDDVGVERESLAFIPVLAPEVVKLDLGLLRSVADPETVTVAGAVRAYAESSGAEVVAEGIETPEDLTRALVLGATLGQGWLWGRPERTLREAVPAPERFAARPPVATRSTTPFALATARHRVRRAPKRLLLPLSTTLETAALEARVPPLLLSCFQHERHFTSGTARRYARLAAHLPFVACLAEQMPHEPAPGVRGTRLRPDDPLAAEWTVVVLGAHDAVALVAREADVGAAADGDREFDFLVTHDRALVTELARLLVDRIAPS